MKMKRVAALLMAAVVMSAPVSAQPFAHQVESESIVKERTITVGPASFWRKVAHYVTFGAVQTTSNDVQVNQPFSLAADHNALEVGLEVDGYRLYIDGKLVRTATVAEVWTVNQAGGVVKFSGITLPKGTHTLAISAFNDGPTGPAEAMSAALTSVAKPGKPKAPTNLRVILG